MKRTAFSPLNELSFPIQYLEVCQSLVTNKGGDFSSILSKSGIDSSELLIPMKRINGEQLLAIYVEALTYCNSERPYALQVLEHFPITAHGLIGILALTSPKLEDALNAAVQFFPFLMPAFSVQRVNTPNEVHLLFRPTCSFGQYDVFFSELIPLALCQITPFLSEPPDQICCHFSHKSVFNPLIYKQTLNIDVRFDAKVNRLIFSKKTLNISLLTQSAGIYRQTKSSLQEIHHASYENQTLTGQIRQIILDKLDRNVVINSDSIARSLHMSERTLARRLAREGQTILKIKNDIRLNLAKQLLRDHRKQISAVANQLGFSSTENFARYFKQMTKKTPRQFRQAHQ